MPKQAIDFEDLPYDLYLILNLSPKCSLEEIKNNYKKAVIQYHPDKNNNTDPEFFNFINLAYKILSDSTNRHAYDDWRNWKGEHENLKNNFKNNQTIPITHKKNFKELEEELNKKHGYIPNNDVISSNDTKDLLNRLQQERNNILIPNYNVTSGNLNQVFDQVKTEPNKFKQDLIPYSGEIMEFNKASSNYASLDDIGTLYKEGEKLMEKNYSSYSVAFGLQQKVDYKDDGKSLEEKMKEYETMDLKIKNKKKNSK
jgi:curved DNA-binding protein CbpA